MSVRTAATATASASALLLTLGLTACGQLPAAEACAPALQPGSISNTVTALGEFGTQPIVSFPTPAGSVVSQRTVAHAAEDRSTVAEAGDLVAIDFVMLESNSGQITQQTPFGSEHGSSVFILDEQVTPPGIVAGLTCAAPGDRLILSLAPQDLFGVEQNLMLGLAENTQMVFVADVVSVSGTHASGAARSLPSGFPAVVSDADQRPGVVLPPAAAPAESRVGVAIEGDGEEVSKDDAVIAQLMSIDWATGRVTKSTWDEGGPLMLGATGSGEPVRGFLDGRTLGSRVVVLQVEDGATTVHVIDLLALALAQTQPSQ